MHMIIVTGLWLRGGSWVCWNFYEDRGPRAGYEGRGPDNPNTLEKQKLNFSRSELFHMKTRVSPKYFVNDSRWLGIKIPKDTC